MSSVKGGFWDGRLPKLRVVDNAQKPPGSRRDDSRNAKKKNPVEGLISSHSKRLLERGLAALRRCLVLSEEIDQMLIDVPFV